MITIVVLVLTLPTSVYNNIQLFTGSKGIVPDVNKIPYGSLLYINDNQTFIIPLDVANPTTSAPAISCSITNNVHLIGIDGSDYSVSSTGPMFTPYAASLLAPNNVQLASARVLVYLYCSPVSSYYSSIGYHAYLTGGSLQMQMNVRTSNGYQTISTQSISPIIPPGAIDTTGSGSVLIGQFNDIPASPINAVFGSSGLTTTNLEIVTNGNVQMKNKLSGSYLTYGYTLSPLYTYLGLINGNSQPTTTTSSQNSCPVGYVSISTGCTNYNQILTLLQPTASNNYKIDKSGSDTIQFNAALSGYSSQEPVPSVDVYRIVQGKQTFVKNIPFGSVISNSGTTTTFQNTLSIKNDLGGIASDYILSLKQVQLNNGVTRQASAIGFTVWDSTAPALTVQNPGTQTTTVTPTTANSYFVYQQFYTDGTNDNGNLASRTNFPINFSPAQLANPISSKNLKNLQFAAMVDLSKIGININTANVNIQGMMTLSANGNNLPQWITSKNGIIQQTPISQTFPLFSEGGGQYLIMQSQFTPAQIDTLLSNQNQIATQQNTGFANNGQITPFTIPTGTPITLTVTMNGTFNVITNSATNAMSKGTLSPMSFTQQFTYSPSQVPLSQCTNINPSNPPAGCTNDLNSQLPAGSTAGACTNMTPAQCAALGNSIGPGSNNNQPCATGSGTCNTSSTNGQSQTIQTQPQCTTIFGINTCTLGSTQPSNTQLSTNTTPSQNTNNGVSVCPAGMSQSDCQALITQNVINSLQNSVTTANLNQNIIPIMIVIAVFAGIGIFIFKKRKKP